MSRIIHAASPPVFLSHPSPPGLFRLWAWIWDRSFFSSHFLTALSSWSLAGRNRKQNPEKMGKESSLLRMRAGLGTKLSVMSKRQGTWEQLPTHRSRWNKEGLWISLLVVMTLWLFRKMSSFQRCKLKLEVKCHDFYNLNFFNNKKINVWKCYGKT